MSNKLTPMIHVEDIQASITWYEKVGFEVLMTNQKWQPDIELNWCLLELESNRLMLGLRPDGHTKNVTLNISVADVDAIHAKLPDSLDVVYPPTDQFYGQRDFEVRTPNDNSLLIGQPISK